MKKLLPFLLLISIMLCSCGLVKVENPNEKADGVLTYAEYLAAKSDEKVTIEAYIQVKEPLREGKTSLYLMDGEGGYLIREVVCDESEYEKFITGGKVKVSGAKVMVSVDVQTNIPAYIEGTDESLPEPEYVTVAEDAYIVPDSVIREDGSYVASPHNLTTFLGTASLADYLNRHVSFKNVTVRATKNADGDDRNFIYGENGKDIIFTVGAKSGTQKFRVSTELFDENSEIFKTVKSLKIGDKITVNCLIRWSGTDAFPIVTSIKK